MQIRNNYLYKKFSSIKTSILFLGILAVFYLAGTIFPQGGNIEDYINEGGRFVLLVKIFGLMNLFSTPLFLIVSLLLFVNLTICTWERFLILCKETPLDTGFISTHIIQLNGKDEIDEIFIKKLGFRKLYSDTSKTIMIKGLSYKWLTCLYHLGIFLCFIGFFLTYLFAFEDEIIIYPDEIKTIQPSVQSRFNKLFGKKAEELPFKVKLAEFTTEYNQMPSIDYPKERLSRLAIALGWQDKPIKYKIKDESLFPKDWKSRLMVIRDDKLIIEKIIEVNDPLEYGGFTFYQAAFEQKLKVTMDKSPIGIEVEIGKEAILPGIEDALVFKNLRVGTLFRKDGRTEKIIPSVDVYMVKGKGLMANGIKDKEKIGKLELGGYLTIEDRAVDIKEFMEATILSYRYDPGVAILWFAGILVLAAMAMRIYMTWYMIMYRIDRESKVPLLRLSIKARGLLADEAGIIRQIRHFTRKYQ
ncbi:MAG: cytochrome c biogenesis protein ResB [Deltaproteobacteria bacterium]|nr:cytochrome c biogenesis protein ResB [Deltaproteobacteria bacterium]